MHPYYQGDQPKEILLALTLREAQEVFLALDRRIEDWQRDLNHRQKHIDDPDAPDAMKEYIEWSITNSKNVSDRARELAAALIARREQAVKEILSGKTSDAPGIENSLGQATQDGQDKSGE